jgi:hypothetical protein
MPVVLEHSGDKQCPVALLGGQVAGTVYIESVGPGEFALRSSSL